MTPRDPARRPLVRPGFVKWSTVVFVLLLPLVVHAVWQYVETRRLRLRIDDFMNRGEPITEDRYISLSDGAADADRYYRAAAALGSSVGEDLPSAPGPRARAVATATPTPIAGRR